MTCEWDLKQEPRHPLPGWSQYCMVFAPDWHHHLDSTDSYLAGVSVVSCWHPQCAVTLNNSASTVAVVHSGVARPFHSSLPMSGSRAL